MLAEFAILALLALPAERCAIVNLTFAEAPIRQVQPQTVRVQDLPELGQYIFGYFRKMGCKRTYVARLVYRGEPFYELEVVE